MPGESLIEIKSGYTCFSCGSGCYNHEQLYAQGGEIYAHVFGYPAKNNVSGIYRLEQSDVGPYWKKVISGGPRPPLAINPNGRPVAYFELSRLGEALRIRDFAARE